ncbi:MAG: PKD domain-containing protein [Bacteroidetes bacterium]|nr:PKD domain-containing protein [Bacteroidota bacterium]
MKNIFIILFLVVFSAHCSSAEKRKILFLGNSYTYYNDLPNTLKQLALSLGDTLEVDSYTPGGASFQSLSNDANTLAKIQVPGWDYVVLQAQSQEPAFSPAQVQSDTYPFAKKLDSLIHVANPCAETIFYMTWGRKNGDAGNCAAYPPICTYEGMQQRLRESYLEMSLNNQASCSPVGVAWRTFRTAHPAVELYNPDESHPSVNGTYLAACTFYSSIYHKSTLGAAYVLAGVAAADASSMQDIASNTVLDSIENWQQYGGIPVAAFTPTANNLQVNFTNNSMRATIYEWDFGDLSPIDNSTNPTHTYATPGNYTVKLLAKTTCNKYEVKTNAVNLIGIPNGLEDQKLKKKNSIFYHNQHLILPKNTKQLAIINSAGAQIWNQALPSDSDFLDCRFLPRGLYFYLVIDQNNELQSGKFMVQ